MAWFEPIYLTIQSLQLLCLSICLSISLHGESPSNQSFVLSICAICSCVHATTIRFFFVIAYLQNNLDVVCLLLLLLLLRFYFKIFFFWIVVVVYVVMETRRFKVNYFWRRRFYWTTFLYCKYFIEHLVRLDT